ncbi:MAG: hypothetical protein WC763_04755 [Candidatus Paceibacterota bacterium]|jgi:hypothetical protein
MQIVKLSNSEVEIKKSLTLGEFNRVQIALNGDGPVSAAGWTAKNLIEGQTVLLSIVIKKIKEGDKEVAFSREWLDALSLADGSVLLDVAQEIIVEANKKK